MKSVKILILRLSSIGDIVLSSAFIRQVAGTFPNSEIDFVIKSQYAELVQYNPYLNTIYPVESNKGFHHLLKIREILKSNNYDYIFDLHNNFRTRILLTGLFIGKKRRIKKNKIIRALLVWFKWNLYKYIKPIPNRYLDVGKEAGVTDDHKGLEIYWDAKIEHQMERTYSKIMASKYFVLAPGASFYSKKWPIEYFMELVEKLLQKSDANIVIVGGQNDIDDANKLQMNDRIINFAGKVTLLESAIVLKNAEALVSNDSGVMHMAAAVGTPLIGIFGSTVEQFGFFPYRSKFKIIENEGLNCRPCSHVGKDFCPKGHFRCMLELHPQKIYDALIHLI